MSAVDLDFQRRRFRSGWRWHATMDSGKLHGTALTLRRAHRQAWDLMQLALLGAALEDAMQRPASEGGTHP